MKQQSVYISLLFSLGLWLPLAHGASSMVLRCRGRPVMTLSQTDYGLVTEQWGSGEFEVNQGYEDAKLPDGDRVRLYRFRNGDQWFWDVQNGRQFFTYAGQDDLEPCVAGKWYPLETTILPRWTGK